MEQQEHPPICGNSKGILQHIRHQYPPTTSPWKSKNGRGALQHLHTAGHPGLVHLRAEVRRARNIQILRVAHMALDMATGLGAAREFGIDCEGYRDAALYPYSSAEAESISRSGVDPSSHIGSSVLRMRLRVNRTTSY